MNIKEHQIKWDQSNWEMHIAQYARLKDLEAKMTFPESRERVKASIAKHLVYMTERYGKSATKGL